MLKSHIRYSYTGNGPSCPISSAILQICKKTKNSPLSWIGILNELDAWFLKTDIDMAYLNKLRKLGYVSISFCIFYFFHSVTNI